MIDSACRNLQSVLAALVLLACCGCSDGPGIADEVTGRVTRHGQPVAGVTLNFMPENGRPSWAITDAEGRYTLHYSKEYEGGLMGKHKVFVTFRDATPEEERLRLTGKLKRPPDQAAILEKYGNWDTTPLEVEITHSGQAIDLRLD
jgi:hypothetical protein